MLSSLGVSRLEVATLSPEEVMPQIQLKYAGVNLKPSNSKISPLSAERDVLPEGRQIYQLIVTYNLHITKQAEVSLNVPQLSHMLYESEFESQLWMIFDSNKAVCGYGDSYSAKNSMKLSKGDYTIRLQIRHEKRDLLEKISDLNMVALFKLGSVVNMEIYEHYNHALVGGGQKLPPQVVYPDIPKVYFIANLSNEKITKMYLPANTGWLTGVLTYSRDDFVKRADQRRFQYVLSSNELARSNHSKNGSSDSANKTNSSESSGSNTNALNSSSVTTTPTKGGASNDNGSDSPSPPEVPSTAGDGLESSKKTPNNDFIDALRDFKCSMITKLGKFRKITAIILKAAKSRITFLLAITS